LGEVGCHFFVPRARDSFALSGVEMLVQQTSCRRPIVSTAALEGDAGIFRRREQMLEARHTED